MREVNPLKFFPVDEGAVEGSPGLEGWLRYWWGYNLNKMWRSDWFEVQGSIFAGAGASCIIKCDRVTIGNSSSLSVLFPPESSLFPNDIFVEEKYGE